MKFSRQLYLSLKKLAKSENTHIHCVLHLTIWVLQQLLDHLFKRQKSRQKYSFWKRDFKDGLPWSRHCSPGCSRPPPPPSPAWKCSVNMMVINMLLENIMILMLMCFRWWSWVLMVEMATYRLVTLTTLSLSLAHLRQMWTWGCPKAC